MAFGAAGIALVALFFTGVAAKAAKDQTEIQRQLRRDSAQPYVWADVREDSKQGSLLEIVVGNNGPTVATNVRVVFTPELPAAQRNAELVRGVQERLEQGLKSIAPGRIIRWSLGLGSEILATEGSRAYSLTVTADGPFGRVEPLEYMIDMDDWRAMKDQPDGSLHLLRKSIDEVGKKVGAFHATYRDRREPPWEDDDEE